MERSEIRDRIVHVFQAQPSLLERTDPDFASLHPGYWTYPKGYNVRPRTRKGGCALTPPAKGLN